MVGTEPEFPGSFLANLEGPQIFSEVPPSKGLPSQNKALTMMETTSCLVAAVLKATFGKGIILFFFFFKLTGKLF